MTAAMVHLTGFEQKREPWPRSLPDRQGPWVLSDDPADHGLSAAEVACIREAYALRRRALRMEIERRWRPSRGGGGWLAWPGPTNTREWLQAIVLLPIFNALLILVRLLEPIGWIPAWRAHRRARATLREELVTLEGPPYLQPVGAKTLGGLWQLYGLEAERFTQQACVELLSAWIEGLYGADTRRSMDLDGRLERIARRRAASRARIPGLVCVLGKPPFDVLLQELSRELPPYDWATRSDQGGGPAGGERTLH